MEILVTKYFTKWKIECNNKNGDGKIHDFIKSTKTNSPTGSSGATSIPPIGDAFMYIETSGNNSELNNNNIFVSFERTDIINISNITFYYNRFSIVNHDKTSMGRFRIQLFRNGSWETKFTIEKNTEYSTNSTDWTLLNLDFTGLD